MMTNLTNFKLFIRYNNSITKTSCISSGMWKSPDVFSSAISSTRVHLLSQPKQDNATHLISNSSSSSNSEERDVFVGDAKLAEQASHLFSTYNGLHTVLSL
jgi:hypothetical protein